jgi:DNA-binding IclR family transcriptional regulator
MEAAKREGLYDQRAKASPLTLLEILTRQPARSLPLFDLQAQSGMEPAQYGESLKSLLAAGFIEIEGAVPEQTIRLTDRGADIVRLAQPA